MVELERRAHERLIIARPCKLYLPRVGKYLPGSTCNLSAGGALVEVERPLHVEPGAHLHVGIALKRRQGLLLAGEMLDAQVVRFEAEAGSAQRSAVAVRFSAPGAAAQAALRRAA
ncbi:MAG: PilZ domain-containing protein [Planctomycetota bacterium]|jgi:hypothetical protein